MRLVNSLGRISFLPAPLPSPRNCADNGTNIAAKAREVVCPVLINETDDPGVKEAVGFR
jgi:hypothetical protein